jgi:hypothetical protein
LERAGLVQDGGDLGLAHTGGGDEGRPVESEPARTVRIPVEHDLVRDVAAERGVACAACESTQLVRQFNLSAVSELEDRGNPPRIATPWAEASGELRVFPSRLAAASAHPADRRVGGRVQRRLRRLVRAVDDSQPRREREPFAGQRPETADPHLANPHQTTSRSGRPSSARRPVTITFSRSSVG